MNRWWPRAGIAVVVLAIGGFLFASSGLFNVAASSGHWPVTRWLLHYTMRRSVTTHALSVETPPPLDDPAKILRGAGHYATGCAPCHGEPGSARGPIPREMTPEVPGYGFEEWQPRELFWIVKHGIKYTAMPAWVARDRDDEIWSIVAFLERLPGLSAEQYRELAYGPAIDRSSTGIDQLDDFDPVLADCVRCHGHSGTGRGAGAFPRLDIQSEAYLRVALESYASGRRASGIMQPIAGTLDSQTIWRVARHYASANSVANGPQRGTSGDVHYGRRIAEQGLPMQGVPPCTHCHGPAAVARNPLFPVLAGQHPDYLVQQLELFREGTRGGGPYAGLMREVADGLKTQQIEAVAAFYGSLQAAEAQ